MKVIISEVVLVRMPPVKGFWSRFFDAQQFKLKKDVRFIIGSWRGTIKKDLVLDFASIPRILKPFFPDSIIFGNGALLHDWLYANGIMGKRICDSVLAGLIQDVDGGTNLQAEIVFMGVHLFGFRAWNKHRRRERVEANASLTSKSALAHDPINETAPKGNKAKIIN